MRLAPPARIFAMRSKVHSGLWYTYDKILAPGTILIEAEEMQNVNSILKLTISGNHLDKKDFFGKSGTPNNVSNLETPGSFLTLNPLKIECRPLRHHLQSP